MTIGVLIATYQRTDGTTPVYLKRALNSIKNQTYTNYRVFLIGDKYEDNEEFESLAKSIIPTEKIFWVNLPFARERDKYPLGDIRLWCAGGVNALNNGIEIALNNGLKYLCHLDHDDWWENNHLEEISKTLDQLPFLICTKSTHINNQILPKFPTIPYYPKNSDIIHSAVCIDFSKTTIRYKDLFQERGKAYPADADLWNRISVYMKEEKLKGILINKITCNHVNERK